MNVRVDDAPAGVDSRNVTITADAAGNAYALWLDERPGMVGMYYAYRPAGGNWQASQKVDDNVPVQSDVPWVAADDSGNLYAVWTDSREGGFDIYFSKHPFGGVWSANSKVNDVNTFWTDCPSIAVDSTGNAHAIWYDIDYYNWL